MQPQFKPLRSRSTKSLAAALSLAAILVSPHLRAADAAAQATGSLDLDGAVGEAERGSPALQRSEATLDEASWGRTETFSGFLPKFQLSAQHIFDYKLQLQDISIGGGPLTEFPLVFPTSQLVLEGSLPLFDGLANVNTYRAGTAKRDAAELERDWTRFQLQHEVALRYYETLAADKLGEVARQNVKTLDDHLSQTNAKLKAGTATSFDRLRVEVQLNEARSEELKSEDDYSIARKKLANTMGLDDDSRALTGQLPVPATIELETVAKLANGRADIEAQEKKVEALDHAASARSTYWVPRLSLNGNFIKYNNLTDNISDWSQYRNAYNLGFFLTWNLFDGLASTSKAREAAAQQVQAERALQQTRLAADTELVFWKKRYAYSLALFHAKSSDAEKAQESVRLARIGYRAGTLTSTEVLDAELDLFRARAGVIQAQLGCAEALLKLELSLGRKI